ncbi:MAG: Lar family restriction alleviation protein [Patescibacteria group bacterium]
MSDELKPCPFCGSGASETFNGTVRGIRCDDCAADISWYADSESAKTAWNIRAADADPNADTLTAAIVEAAKNKADKIITAAIIERAVEQCHHYMDKFGIDSSAFRAVNKIFYILEGGE